MKIILNSGIFAEKLSVIGKIIPKRATLPILDCVLLQTIEESMLITATDLENTLTLTMPVPASETDGIIAIPWKLLFDIIKEIPEQPLTIVVDVVTFKIEITTDNGLFTIVGQDANDYPVCPKIEAQHNNLQLSSDVLLKGIQHTIFATGDNELRPVMNGIFIGFEQSQCIVFAASDSHKLVKYKNFKTQPQINGSIIFNKTSAAILKSIIQKQNTEIELSYDSKNMFFSAENFTLVSRLIEGIYPNFDSVIPTDNPTKIIVNNTEIYNSIKRVSIFSNTASNLVRFSPDKNQLKISAQDIDFSISAYETINLQQFEGEQFEFGLKSTLILELLQNLPKEEIIFEMSEPQRAILIFPTQEIEEESLLMLIMPMTIN